VRRALILTGGVVVVLAGIVALVLAFSSRDDAQLSGSAATGPGELQPDRGSGHGSRAQPQDDPPTSGPHSPDLVTRDRRPLTDDQLLHALELGNVVILYEGDPAPALERLQEDVAGPFDAELAAAGQAVILAPRPGSGPATALAWRHVLRADDPGDAGLREFAEAWLGEPSGAQR
jgi:hypothetical protein